MLHTDNILYSWWLDYKFIFHIPTFNLCALNFILAVLERNTQMLIGAIFSIFPIADLLRLYLQISCTKLHWEGRVIFHFSV